MGDEKQSKAKPTDARRAIAENVEYLMRHHGLDGITELEIERRGGPSAKTLKRLQNVYTDTGPTLDTLDEVAKFFGVETHELLKRRPSKSPTPTTPSQAAAELSKRK